MALAMEFSIALEVDWRSDCLELVALMHRVASNPEGVYR
jgi:hypothetical protein